jgi:NTE family protein
LVAGLAGKRPLQQLLGEQDKHLKGDSAGHARFLLSPAFSADKRPGRRSERGQLLRYIATTEHTRELVDFNLINSHTTRLSVGATNVRTGASTYFNSDEQPIGLSHILASASLPPGFAPTEVDGEFYWDGAVVSNTPMQYVIDTRQRNNALIFQVDLWDPVGEVPLDIPSAFLRATESRSASRVNISIDQYKKMESYRQALCEFFDRLPKQYRDDPEVAFLEQEARVKAVTIVQLKYRSNEYEVSGKTFEFSRRAMENHWQAGCDDTKIALAEPAVLDPPSPGEALRIFDVRHGWMK